MLATRFRWGELPSTYPRRVLYALMVAAVLLIIVPLVMAVPGETALAAPTPPHWASSYYMKTVNPTTFYNMGCAQGRHDRVDHGGNQDSLIIFHFGMPISRNGQHGTSLYINSFGTTTQIGAAVQQFAKGFYDCSDDASHARLAIGTSNYGRQVTYNHGRAWAEMTNAVSEWVIANGYGSQVDIAAASDMEMGWNTPAVTRAWVDGYASAHTRLLYNFGDAAGCPPYGKCGTAAYPQWTQEHVWYISWGARPAWPLPEIYQTNGANAQQWYRLSLYSYLNHGMRMDFHGVLTQRQACRQVGCPAAINNSPAQGWTQLWNALNADTRTAQNIRWSADIRWWP